MAYSPNENCFCIDCDHTEYEIDKKTFDESAALYNEIMDYSEKNNTVFNGEKLELTIRNGSSLDYLVLRNFDENDEDACQKECSYVTISYYVGKTNKVYESDIDSFIEKKSDEVFGDSCYFPRRFRQPVGLPSRLAEFSGENSGCVRQEYSFDEVKAAVEILRAEEEE